MRILIWSLVVLGVVSALLGLLLICPRTRSTCRDGNARNAQATLRTFVSAQEDFVTNDRDGDGRREYWREDVAGLYAFVPPGDVEMIQLIEISAAAADLRPEAGRDRGTPGPALIDLSFYAEHVPKAGHWFAALAFEDERELRDPRRFAFCAIPDSLAAGRKAFAITQDGVLWERPVRWGGDLPDCFPLDPAAEGWRRVQ